MKWWKDEMMKGWNDERMKGWNDERMKGWTNQGLGLIFEVLYSSVWIITIERMTGWMKKGRMKGKGMHETTAILA